MIEVVDTGIAKSAGPVSSAVVASGSRTLYLASIPKDPQTGTVIQGDIETQARQTFSNMQKMVEAAGGSLSDIAQVLIYLVDSKDAAGMNKVYKEFFESAPYPNRATVVVKELLVPGMCIEVVANAALV